jgi:hypothetical protein
MVFETIASAGWATRASEQQPPAGGGTRIIYLVAVGFAA